MRFFLLIVKPDIVQVKMPRQDVGTTPVVPSRAVQLKVGQNKSVIMVLEGTKKQMLWLLKAWKRWPVLKKARTNHLFLIYILIQSVIKCLHLKSPFLVL